MNGAGNLPTATMSALAEYSGILTSVGLLACKWIAFTLPCTGMATRDDVLRSAVAVTVYGQTQFSLYPSPFPKADIATRPVRERDRIAGVPTWQYMLTEQRPITETKI